jgi:hypothetical protein
MRPIGLAIAVGLMASGCGSSGGSGGGSYQLTGQSRCYDYTTHLAAQEAYAKQRTDLGSTVQGAEDVIYAACNSSTVMGDSIAQHTMGAPKTLGDISCDSPGVESDESVQLDGNKTNC